MVNHPHQQSLFDVPESPKPSGTGAQPEVIAIKDGELSLYHNWIDSHEANAAFEALSKQLAWEQSVIQIYGKPVSIPRLNAWYGDAGCHYGYSGYQLPLHDWHPTLLRWRQKLQDDLGLSVNSALANLYRDGQDGVGWHSDDEPELGRDPTIASISLGVQRNFHLKHRFDASQPTIKLSLPPGSLLIMSGKLQRFWLHSLPKSKRIDLSRINLTYRHIKLG